MPTTTLVDIVVMKPRDAEQLELLADRLHVQIPKEWRRTLRWAGRHVLITHADDTEAERVLSAAKEAGITVAVRPSHPEGPVERFIVSHYGSIARSLFALVAVGVFIKLYFFRSYNALVHLAGLLWLMFISRDHDPKVFDTIGPIAGALVSVILGYIAMISVHVALAWMRLGPPLVATTRAEVTGEIHPVPRVRAFNWRKLLPGGAIAIGLVAIYAGGTALIRRFDPRGAKPPALPTAVEPNRALPPVPADPWKARAELEDRARPRPDRRFLLALGDLDRLTSGSPSAVEVAWSDGAWRVSIAGRPIGALPATPSFDDALALLRTRAAQLAPAVAGGRVPVVEFGSDDDALAHLRDAQARWSAGRPDPATIHEAAQALVALSFHLLDETEEADALAARAFAATALDEHLQGAPEPALQALLASAMQYEAGARTAASALASSDPLRLYLLRDPALEQVAASGPAWPRILWLRRLERSSRYTDAARWRETQLASVAVSIGALHSRLLHSDDPRGHTIQAALPDVQAALDRELLAEREDSLFARLHGVFQSRPADVPLFEALDRRLGAVRGAGPLFDAELIRSYFRAAADSGVAAAVRQLEDGFGDADLARDFFTKLGTPVDPHTQSLAVWAQAHFPYASRYEYTRGKPQPEQLAASMQLGPRLVEDAVRFATDADPIVLDHARRMVIARMDTRPSHRALLAADALHVLHDVSLSERACAGAVVELAEDDDGAAVCARVLGDRQRLLALAHSPAAGLHRRAQALTFLADVKLATAEEIGAEFERLLPADDAGGSATSAYVDMLESEKRFAAAQGAIERWLALHSAPSIAALFFHAAHARMLQRQGNAAQAWSELEPLIDSWHGSVLMRASLVLAELGRKEEAVAIARRRLERYKHQWSSLTTLVEVQWRTGDLEGAKQTLHAPPWQLDGESWRAQIGPAFARAFEGAPDEKAQAAFATLRTAGFTVRSLRDLALGTTGMLRDELVLQMLLPVVEAGATSPQSLVDTAQLIRKVKGVKAAAEWLAPRIRPDDTVLAARAMFESGDSELLWTALPEAATDRVWLLRAAAARRFPEPARTAAVTAHFAAAQGNEDYLLGRYVAGLGDESSIRASSDRTRTAWALAVRAEAETRREDAIGWYGVALAGGWTSPERRFAEQALSAWSEERIKTMVATAE